MDRPYISYLEDAENVKREQEMEDAKARARSHRQTLCDAVRDLMGKPDGRLLMRWIQTISGTFEAGYCNDPALAQYREGRRAVGMDIFKLCQEAGVAEELLKQE